MKITKSICALSAAIVLAGSTAVAAAQTNTKKVSESARSAFAQSGSTGHAVVVEGKTVGNDPDANVRLQLLRNSGSWNR